MQFSPETFTNINWTVEPDAHGTGTVNGSAVDCLHYREAAFSFRMADDGAAGTMAGSVEESADGSTGWTAVSGASFTAITGPNVERHIRVHMEGRKRYLRGVLTVGVNAIDAAVCAIKVNPKDTRDPKLDTNWIKA